MMKRTYLALVITSLSLICARPAEAGLILSFNQTVYNIPGVGSTTTLDVLLSQDSTGPQVGVGNELVTGAIELSFATAGSATVVSPSDVTPGAAWDSSSILFGANGANTLIDLGLTSLAGISDLSTPLLLGSFIFTAQSTGTTSVSVATLLPGPSFITVNGDNLDPTSGAGARITVGTQPVVPEPASLALASISGVILAGAGGWLRLRRKA